VSTLPSQKALSSTRPRKPLSYDEAHIKEQDRRADLGRDLVRYDAAANNNAALAAPAPRLLVGGQQLASFCHNDLQRAVLALPGRDVRIVRGGITPNQVGSHRPSYINAILIQSRGDARVGNDACITCRTAPNRGPFPFCCSLPGHFGGCCSNCK